MSGTSSRAPGPCATAVLGPTASGKTSLGVGICQAVGGEMINADSRQVIAELAVGVCKPTPAELRGVVCRGLDWAHLGRPFSAARYRELAAGAIADLIASGLAPVVVGGSGLYLRALLDGFDFGRVPPRTQRVPAAGVGAGESDQAVAELRELLRRDPERAAAIDRRNPRRVARAAELARAGRSADRARPPWRTVRLGCQVGPTELRRRIRERACRLLGAELEAEVESLLARGFSAELLAGSAIGYAELLDWTSGNCSQGEAIERLTTRTWRYARAQMTWLRREPGLVWIDAEQPVAEMVKAALAAGAGTGESPR